MHGLSASSIVSEPLSTWKRFGSLHGANPKGASSSLIHTSQLGGRLTAADPFASVVKEAISPDSSSPSKLSNTLKDAPPREYEPSSVPSAIEMSAEVFLTVTSMRFSRGACIQ